jgi:HAD superfamily hydrolase (TIGR01662 family)
MEKTIGEKIKQARAESKLTQKDLADKLGCTEVMVSRYELGVSQVSLIQLNKIANILGKSASYFLGEIPGINNSTSRDFKKAFVFDLDDTLTNSQQFCGETCARVITGIFPSVDFDYVCELHDLLRGLTIRDLYVEILKKLDIKADIDELVRQDFIIQNENTDKLRIFDGVVEILEFLKSNGKTIYICTNRNRNLMMKVLEANHIQSYFDEVISCVDAGYKKPNPYCLVDLIKRSKIDIKDFIYFGDSVVDSEFATNANIEFIIFDQYLNKMNIFKKLVNLFLESQIVGKEG